MLSIEVIAVGKLKESWWRDAAAEYLRRLAPYARVRVTELAASSITASVSPDSSMAEEGRHIIAALKDDATIIVLDRSGRAMSSERFAELMTSEGEGGKTLQFVVGGAAGLADDVVDRADKVVSLSEMTFTHEMARVFVLEQIYRATTIIAGKKYHY